MSLAVIELPPAAWLTQHGPDQDVAVSTRCRLARNVVGAPFPWRARPEQLQRICDHTLLALSRLDPAAVVVLREQLDTPLLEALLLNRYCSAAWASSAKPGAVVIVQDGTRAAMLNEEDHVRLQCLMSGLAVHEAADTCGAWASTLEEHLTFAQDTEVGYLTASPQHAGVAMRIGILLHLAALSSTGEIVESADAAVQTGCAMRGAFGEGTRGIGGFYQISTTAAGDRGRVAAIDQAAAAARYLIDKERLARERLFAHASGRADLVAASAGARERLASEELPPDEALRAISAIRLSVAMGVTNGSLLRTGRWIGRCAAGLACLDAAWVGRDAWREALGAPPS